MSLFADFLMMNNDYVYAYGTHGIITHYHAVLRIMRLSMRHYHLNMHSIPVMLIFFLTEQEKTAAKRTAPNGSAATGGRAKWRVRGTSACARRATQGTGARPELTDTPADMLLSLRASPVTL